METFREAYRSNEFYVTIDGITSPSFTSVSGLGDGEVQSIDQPDGGSRVTRKVSSGVISFGDITLVRFMDGSKADEELYDWFRAMFRVDGTGRGSAVRKNGTIFVKHLGKTVMLFSFTGAWIKSSKFGDLTAGGEELMKQTIVLSVHTLQRERPPVLAPAN